MTFKNILVPFNGSLAAINALNKAIDIAQKFKANILVIYVIPIKSISAPTGPPTPILLGEGQLSNPVPPTPKTRLIGIERGIEIIDLAKEQCQKRGFNARFEIHQGSREKEILKISSKNFDLLVLGVSPKTTLESMIFGSIAKSLINCKCSLLLVHYESVNPPQDHVD